MREEPQTLHVLFIIGAEVPSIEEQFRNRIVTRVILLEYPEALGFLSWQGFQWVMEPQQTKNYESQRIDDLKMAIDPRIIAETRKFDAKKAMT